MVVLFFAVIVPHLDAGKIILTTLFSLATLVMIITTVMASYIDPSDTVMTLYRNSRN